MKNKSILASLLLVSVLSGCSFEFPFFQTPSSSTEETLNLEHNITFVENENCDIILSKEKAYRNEEITVEVINLKENFKVEKITVNDYFIDDNKFIMPNEDVIVEVFLSQKVNNGEKKYYVKAVENEFALITLNSNYYSAGEIVEIDYTCKSNYVLDKFYVNDVSIEGTTFIMPEEVVKISGTFIDAIPYTPWQVSCLCSGQTARAHWYFEYGEEGLNITVKVEDKRVCGEEFVSPGRDSVAYSDNIEFVIGPKSATEGLDVGKTIKILVSYDGRSYVQFASSTTAFGSSQGLSVFVFNANGNLRSLENKDGYNGYEINMFLSYGIFSLNRGSALNNLATCIAMRNTTTYGGSGTSWNCYKNDSTYWKNCSKQPVILEDGSLLER